MAALTVLALASNSMVASRAIRITEQWATRRTVDEVVAADAIVVLSAGRLVPPGAPVSEWHDANRFFGAIELLRAGKAPLLVFTGAQTPWEPTASLEGEVLAGYARDFGVPGERLLVTGEVSNTADEARKVADLLVPRFLGRPPRVVLVTSAFHMPRARTLFEQRGLAVDPFPVDFSVPANRRFTLLDVLPSVSALATTETALRELYGRGYYSLRRRVGW